MRRKSNYKYKLFSSTILSAFSFWLISCTQAKEPELQKMNQHETSLKALKSENKSNIEANKEVHSVSKHKESKPSSSIKKSEGIASNVAYRWLLNGNIRYRNGKLRNDGQSQFDRTRLYEGQKPHTIILSCSDSRVPPEIVFDQKLGEVFVVRTAGEALDSSAIASIEYAVEHLGSHLLVVMGHESCGAVKSVLSLKEGQDAGSQALNQLVADVYPRIDQFIGKKPSKGFLTEVKANALGVAHDLLGRSEIISEKVVHRELQIKTAVYHLESGWVEFFSAQQGRGLASSEK